MDAKPSLRATYCICIPFLLLTAAHGLVLSFLGFFLVLLCDLKISATFLSGDKKNGDFEDDAAMRVFKSGSVLFRLWVRVSQIIPTYFMCLY